MHRIGGRIAVGKDQTALPVKLAPAGLVAGIAVHGIKAGGRVGVHIIGLIAEGTRKIHPDQR